MTEQVPPRSERVRRVPIAAAEEFGRTRHTRALSLGAAAVAYALRRRGRCRTCGRGEVSEPLEPAPAS